MQANHLQYRKLLLILMGLIFLSTSIKYFTEFSESPSISFELFFHENLYIHINIYMLYVLENNGRVQQRVAGTICRKTRQPTRLRIPRESLILRIGFRWSLTRKRMTPTVLAWISTKRRYAK